MGHRSVPPLGAFTPLAADPGGLGIFRSVVVVFLLCGCDPVLKRNKQGKAPSVAQRASSVFDMSECSTWCGRFRPLYLPPANVCFPGQKCRPLTWNFPNKIRRACMSVLLHLEALLCLCVCVCPICFTRMSIMGRCVLWFASWEQSCSASCRSFSPRDVEHLTLGSAGMKESIRQKWM